MNIYELRFEIEQADEASYEAVEEHFDIVVSMHGKSVYLTVMVDGATSAISAAQKAINIIAEAGIKVRRLSEDLVSRAGIAERTGMTRQAVGMWIRGERRKDQLAFPEPYHPVAGGIWLWSDVNTWLHRTTNPGAENISYPDRCDYAVINAEMLNRRADEATYSVVAHFPNRVTSTGPIKNNCVLSGDNAWTNQLLLSQEVKTWAPLARLKN